MYAWHVQSWKLGLVAAGAALQLNAHAQEGMAHVAVGPAATTSAPEYLADLKNYMTTYRDAIGREITSGDASIYYRTSYYLHGLAAGAEASGDIEIMDQLVGFAEQMMAQAKPLVRNGVTYLEFGPWDPNGNPQMLNTFQATGALARTAAVIAGRPLFKARYGAKARQIAAFVEQSIFSYWFDKKSGVYSDPRSPRLGGIIPWLPVSLGGWGTYPVWNDKCSHLGMISTWMYQATGKPIYLEYATRVAKGFRGHVTEQNGCWICDKGIVPVTPGVNRVGSPDTSHANREPMMLVSMHEAGIVFNRSDIKAVADTFTNLIWNQSETDPKFSNFIDGGNLMYESNMPWENGIVYHGWDMLGRYSAPAQQVLANSYRAMKVGAALNPSLAHNFTSYGRILLSGTLARNIAQ